ncbi:flagellin N-terminal helical domain-containing protein [Alteromonas oceanisediminis]|uniref:flagellin N-terminal helical domain-containing protein n=1 Tax=Alteromonas oceanisediminis TaxID=2836180 RepID=UPI001BDB6BEB|nr:flagellin [Alteromonas oceanisediminis]MBT0584927.1 flagellin [Alteromonas oceanisediminis]
MINFNSDSSSASLLQQVQQRQDTLFERLASGRRVNSAADDSAAQQIIDRLTSQVEGNRQSITNAFDGISLAQVAESGLEGINNDAQRIRELTLQAGNGALNDADRQALQSEITQLQDNITQTIEQTNFAGRPLLNAESSIDFQVGANAGQQISVGTRDIQSDLESLLTADVTTPEGAQEALIAADESLQLLGGARSDLGATQNQFESAARNLSQSDVNASAARSRIQDTDFAQATSDSAAAGVLAQSNLTVQAQANQQQGQVLALLS